MFAAVVQERLDGGWLEFTLKTTLDEQPFNQVREAERIVRANPVFDMHPPTTAAAAAAAAVSMRAVIDGNTSLEWGRAAQMPLEIDAAEPLELSSPPRIVQGAWGSNNIVCLDDTSTGFYSPYIGEPAARTTDEALTVGLAARGGRFLGIPAGPSDDGSSGGNLGSTVSAAPEFLSVAFRFSPTISRKQIHPPPARCARVVLLLAFTYVNQLDLTWCTLLFL
jgi:hypothetical protein